MLVNELLNLFVDKDCQEIKIYDSNENKIYDGKYHEMPTNYGYLNIASIQNIGKHFGNELEINIY